jgi:hypothetical protein
MGAIQFISITASSSTQELSSPTPVALEPTSTLPPATAQNTVTSVPPTMQPTITSPSVTATPAEPTASPSPLPPTAAFTSTPVQDSLTATVQPAQPSQETTYDNKDGPFVYSEGWVEEPSPYAIDGSYARTSTNGASVTFQFTGQSFSVIYKGGPSYRKMDLYIDGLLSATLDERHDVSTYKARWDYPGQLSPGPHTLKLVFVTTSSSTNGSVDAVIIR